MKYFFQTILPALVLCGALFFLPGAAPAGVPEVHVDNLDDLPDLCQRDRRARLPGGGRGYCAPVAVSNSLMWLAAHGYPELLPGIRGRRMTQGQLAGLLGRSKYMDTSIKRGTSPGELIRGVTRFLKERAVIFSYLGYQGWRRVPKAFDTGIDVPELDWMKAGLLDDGAVWLNLGWYKLDPETGAYTRTGGHWVTLAGYGQAPDGKKDPLFLVVHDPATYVVRRKSRTAASEPADVTRAAAAPKPDPARAMTLLGHDFVKLQRIDRGTLRTEDPEAERSAVGYYQVLDIRSMEKEADVGILDGAVVLKLKRMQTLDLVRESTLETVPDEKSTDSGGTFHPAPVE